MIRAQVEYLGFEGGARGRSYRLRARVGSADYREYCLLIAHEAFTSRRVRFQDAAEICFLKLQRDLAAAGDLPVPLQQAVTDAELEAYRAGQAAKTPRRRAPFA